MGMRRNLYHVCAGGRAGGESYKKPSAGAPRKKKGARRKGVSMFYVPWWVLLACLLASAVATYLVLRRTQAGHSPWVLFPLTAVLAPVVLVGAMVAALTLSTLLSALVEDRTGGAATNHPSEPRAPSERTMRDPTTTVERTQPATTVGQPTSTATATSSATSTATATATATAYP